MREKTFRLRFIVGYSSYFPIYGSMLIMAESLADAQIKACEIAKENDWTLNCLDEEYP